MTDFSPDPAALAGLTALARQQIALVTRPIPWDSPGPALDVAIIGGGQSGIGLAFALARAGITRCAVFEAQPPGQAGVWTTTARMETLRTEKTITGLDQGIPALSIEAWIVAQWGQPAWDEMGRIPRVMWQDYLDWFRTTVGITPVHDHRLADVSPGTEGLDLTFTTPTGPRRISARHLVLATGVDGLGAPFIPEPILSDVVPSARAHTADPIDFAALRGRRVAVIGAASSAFDAAATALEQGAAEVHLLARAPGLATQPPHALARNPLLYRPFRNLPDADRWQIITRGRARGHAPQSTIARAGRHHNFHLHQGAVLRTARHTPAAILLETATRSLLVDFVICGTGYRTDLTLRPELAQLAGQVRLWRDVPVAANDPSALTEWGDYPWLDRDLAFVPRGDARWVGRIHAFNYGAVLSHGYHVGDIGSHDTCIRRLTQALQDRLFADSAERLLAPVLNPDRLSA